MSPVQSMDGQQFREMFSTATNWLEKSAADIDALNVFPVPDGDTGTNMLLTMKSAVEEALKDHKKSVGATAEAMAHGALMGARGNSGVILSQVWKGLATGLDGKNTLDGTSMAEALLQASSMAYKGISNPVEGTILTVAKDAAAAAGRQATAEKHDLEDVLEAAVTAAGESVANTPNLLATLREAGVVDAGGQGYYVLLDGALRYLRGEAERMQYRKPQIIASAVPAPARTTALSQVDEVPFGYCTEFLLKGDGFNPDNIRARLIKKGESLIVVGDSSTVRVHIHTLDPGNIIHYATSLGTLHQVSMRNMDEQHQDFLAMQKERAPSVDIATVAVVSGDGLADVFKSLGITTIVSGGQTMNPSTKDLLNAVKSVKSDKVFILPNNKNIIMTAEQVPEVTDKHVEIVPTRTIPQGIAALLAFDYEANFETNTKLMTEAAQRVRTIEITRAVRATQLNGLKIAKRQAIGMIDGDLLAAGKDPADVLNKMLSKLDTKKSEIVTVYYGADTDKAEADAIAQGIQKKYSHVQIEVIEGGQPYYNYIVSIE